MYYWLAYFRLLLPINILIICTNPIHTSKRLIYYLLPGDVEDEPEPQEIKPPEVISNFGAIADALRNYRVSGQIPRAYRRSLCRLYCYDLWSAQK